MNIYIYIYIYVKKWSTRLNPQPDWLEPIFNPLKMTRFLPKPDLLPFLESRPLIFTILSRLHLTLSKWRMIFLQHWNFSTKCNKHFSSFFHFLVFGERIMMCIDNSLILHIYIIIRKHYNTYFELIHAFYIWFWNNVE